jgi:hypothetical protein
VILTFQAMHLVRSTTASEREMAPIYPKAAVQLEETDIN